MRIVTRIESQQAVCLSGIRSAALASYRPAGVHCTRGHRRVAAPSGRSACLLGAGALGTNSLRQLVPVSAHPFRVAVVQPRIRFLPAMKRSSTRRLNARWMGRRRGAPPLRSCRRPTQREFGDKVLEHASLVNCQQ
jgi:hypothetical protein